MKRSIPVVVLLAATVAMLVSCGGYNNSSTPQSTNIKTRAFVSNTFGGILGIVDYTKDQQVFGAVSVGSSPTMMVVSDDRSRTMVFNSSGNSVSIVDNATEASLGSIALTGATESMDISSDNKTAYVAVRNAPVTNSASGSIYVVDLSGSTTTATINVPLVRQLSLNAAGTSLLGVTSDPAGVSSDPANFGPKGQIAIIDTASKAVTATINSNDPAYDTTVDRPIQAIFSSDGTKAYIVNCGAECGGTTPSVSILDLSAKKMVAGSTVVLQAASVALLDGNTLYVAGSVPGSNGVLTPVTINGTTLTAGTPVTIGNGFHRVIGKGSSNKVFVGATDCTNNTAIPNSGCLSIFDTSKKTAVVDNAKGFVTGMDPVPNRDVMYVVEGGELRIYDTTTSDELAGHLVDILGGVSDVKIIDKK